MKTKIIAEFQRRATLDDGSVEFTFKSTNWNYRKAVAELENKSYTIELNEVKNARSLQQNKFLWALIHEIAVKENGHLQDEFDTYCALLELSNAKYEWVRVLSSAVETLKATQGIRALKVIRTVEDNGKEFADCKVYIGSSKFNTIEMRTLIDTTIAYAETIGIDTKFYDDVLR